MKNLFPVFSKNSELIYLDSAASSLKPQYVIDRICEAYSYEYANIHRGQYQLSIKATENVENSRRLVASSMNCKYEEVIFTKNATESINLVAKTLVQTINNSPSRNKIVITALEHHANIIPWQQFCSSSGYELVVIPIDENYELLEPEKYLNEEVLLFAFTHISNVTGTVNDVKTLVKIASKFDILTLVDGCQGMVHTTVDVKDMNCDFYVWSSHKINGPSGVGVLYGKEELLEKLPPFLSGGDMISKAGYHTFECNKLPYKFEAGTPAIAEITALGAAIEFRNKSEIINALIHKKKVSEYCLERLNDKFGDEIKIFRPKEQKEIPVISFLMNWGHPYDIGTFLGKYNVCTRVGKHCAEPLMDFLQITGTIRVSFDIFNDEQDIDILIDKLENIRELLQ